MEPISVRFCLYPRWWQFRQRYILWRLRRDAKKEMQLITKDLQEKIDEELSRKILG